MSQNDHRTAPTPTVSTNSPLVLLVEDEVLILILLAEELRLAGYAVIEAVSADEAFGIISSGTIISLLLTDFRMPGSMTGFQLAELAREKLPNVPIILVSADGAPDRPGDAFLRILNALVGAMGQLMAREPPGSPEASTA
jgi:CheY-like chemotaxis protein